jgi:uncharacterized protein (TIGR02147 family)
MVYILQITLVMLFNFDSYSKYLAAELELRKSTNPMYSLRSMSLHLGISPSTLSDVIKGKKKLSEKTALTVSKRLKLNLKQTRYFQTLVHYENSQDANLRKVLKTELMVLNPQMRKQFEVQDGHYIVLSEWHHIALIELTYLFPKKLTAAIVSEQLNIEIEQAEAALGLLEKLCFIEKKNNSYTKTKRQFTFNSDLGNHALRNFHKTMLGKAQLALVEQTNREKFIGSETFPLSLEDLDQAKDIIENCFQQLLQLSESSQKKTHIYHAGIQLFQLNRPAKKESDE